MKTKQKLPLHFHYISALLLFVVMFGVAYVSQSFAAEESKGELVESCVARIFELDRSITFSDVGPQEWYTHAVNFLVLLDENLATIPDHGENEAPRLPTFLPTQAVRTDEFAKWVSSFSLLFDDSRKESLSKFSSRSKKKMTASTVSQLIAKKFRVPQKTMKEIVKRQPLSGKYVTKGEAALLLLEAAKQVLKASPEKTICAKHADEDLEQFKVLFGLTAEGNETPTPAPLAPTPVTPATPATTSAPLRIAELSFSEKNPKAGDSVIVRVTAQNADATPATDARLELTLSTGRDFGKSYPLQAAGAGTYETTVTSDWAGTYQVGVRQGGAAIGTPQSLTFQPADPSTVALTIATPQEKSASKQEAVIAATLRDKFGNIVDSEARDYRVTTSLGKIKSVQKQGSEILMTIEADAWGEATVLISHLTRSVQDASSSINVPFSSVVLDVPKGVQVGASLTVPVYIFLPPQSGKIGGYRFTLNYEKEDFTLQEVTDGNASDAFPAPTLTRGEGRLQLAANTRALPSEQVIHAANLRFLANTVAGSGTIFIPEGVIINDQEKVIALPESSGAGESLRRWWNSVKAAKDVCLDVWIVEGAVSRAEVLGDVQKASDMFKKSADASFCPFFINWTTNFHHISATDWSTKVNNGTTTAEFGDDADLRANFAGNADCVQIWYVQDIATLPDGTDPIALSYPGNGGIAVDDHLDFDDRTLGHELAHQLSGNDVLDSPDDAGNTQGARNNGNAMNYTNPGDNFTKEQCDLIKQPPYIK